MNGGFDPKKISWYGPVSDGCGSSRGEKREMSTWNFLSARDGVVGALFSESFGANVEL